MEYQHIAHPIQPVYDNQSNILILGSFPSVKSRETAFFYGHPQNRFWRVLANIYDEVLPVTNEEKKQFLLLHHIAVWDVIQSCDIIGSSDGSIKNAVPNDLSVILSAGNIQKIVTNGKTADRLYHRYLEEKTGIPAVCLPSTSPANAAWTFDKLVDVWKETLNF